MNSKCKSISNFRLNFNCQKKVNCPLCQIFWKIPVPTPDASTNQAKCNLSPQAQHCCYNMAESCSTLSPYRHCADGKLQDIAAYWKLKDCRNHYFQNPDSFHMDGRIYEHCDYQIGQNHTFTEIINCLLDN